MVGPCSELSPATLVGGTSGPELIRRCSEWPDESSGGGSGHGSPIVAVAGCGFRQLLVVCIAGCCVLPVGDDTHDEPRNAHDDAPREESGCEVLVHVDVASA